jgi:hypothetical protein
MKQVTRIVAGGQSGVDRAALDFAILRGVPYGGWCPKDGWAEDMTEPPGLLGHYPDLSETPERDPRQRTRWNVRDSDATLVFLPRDGLAVSPGTVFAIACARELAKPFLIVHLWDEDGPAKIREWLESCATPLALNIAGPRESQAPGVYAAVQSALDALRR